MAPLRFIVACHNGRSACIEMLLAKAGDRLDVNQADKHGRTPLFVACQNGRSACIEMLLAKVG
jgi:ankyrin repeat protein